MLYTTIESPVDDLLLVSDGEALCGLYMAAQKHGPQSRAGWRRDDKRFAEAKRQLRAYFAGELTRFDLPLAFSGTEFQRKVWQALTRIPFGQTWSYKTLAQHIGAPKAVRAVGLANGRNPIGIIVPCHRVIGSDGSLTGYGGGLPRKQWLLRHEGAEGVLFGT